MPSSQHMIDRVRCGCFARKAWSDGNGLVWSPLQPEWSCAASFFQLVIFFIRFASAKQNTSYGIVFWMADDSQPIAPRCNLPSSRSRKVVPGTVLRHTQPAVGRTACLWFLVFLQRSYDAFRPNGTFIPILLLLFFFLWLSFSFLFLAGEEIS